MKNKPPLQAGGVASGSPAARGYHHGNLRAALIEAGLLALEQTDTHDLSLRDLARRVEVSANAVYRHFANKEALLVALAAEGFRRLQAAQVQAVCAHADPDQGFRAAGRAYVQFAIDHPSLFRLMYGGFTAAQNNPELVEASMTGLRAAMAMVAQHVGLPPDDGRVLPYMLLSWAITHGLGHLALGGQLSYLGPDPGALIDEVFQLANVVRLDSTKAGERP